MPFDNIKTRMQSIGSNYSGLLDCGKKMLAAEGVAVFWRGTTPRLVRVMVSLPVLWRLIMQSTQLSMEIY
jgi:solute carrier family 25 citrate transporter 1